MRTLDDLTTQCIRCGFCLESCPTFVLTGQETESPRGRIYLARSAEAGKIDWESARPHLNACLGCRACETACPSGVEYSAILELARDRLEEKSPHRTKQVLLSGITDPKKLRLQLTFGKLLPGKRIPGLLSKLLSGQSPEANRPAAQHPAAWKAFDESTLPSIKGEVYLLEGCAMRVLFPRVHQATRRLLRRVGFIVRESNAGCCGALHAHSGLLDEGQEMARKLSSEFSPGTLPPPPLPLASEKEGRLPIIINSAGCGSHLKDLAKHGELDNLDGRLFDISEFLLENGLIDELKKAEALREKRVRATYHDACHLAHGQKITQPPRQLLEAVPGLELIPLPESDMCCGSAGIYNVMQPIIARQLLDRKWAHIEATGADVCVLGNPGCHAWIAQAALEHGAKIRVLHTAEILESAFSGFAGLENESG